MPKPSGRHIVIIGCGNLAWHLAKKLRALDCTVSVYNHRKNPVLDKMSTQLHCRTSSAISRVERSADVYLICVADQFIAAVSQKIAPLKKNAWVLHCSGAQPLSVLQNPSGLKGVLYPVQSFSIKNEVNWIKVPLLLESASAAQFRSLDTFAALISSSRKRVSSADRAYYHLAAVLVNNFTNALFVAADDLLKHRVKDAHPELMEPLIENTLDKRKKLGAKAAQTGPALRGDKEVMSRHKEMLKGHKALKKVYSSLSKLIKEQHT